MTLEQSQPIPIEKGWPLLGVLPKMFIGDPFEYLKNIMLEQGDFVQLNILNQPVYLVSHPDYLKRILWENYHNYRKPGMFYDTAREIMGNGLVVSDGELWLRQRRMIQPHLHRKQLGNIFSDLLEGITEVLNSWNTLAKNNTEFELGDKMAEISSIAISRILFGKKTLPDAEVTEISHRIIRINKFGSLVGMLPKWVPLSGKQQFYDDINTTRETVNHIIAEGRQNKEAAASLIQMLIHAVDEETNQPMSEQQLFDEVMTMVIAGYETTAAGLTWLGAALEKNPHVLKKLHAEIDQVLSRRVPTFEDVPRLIYTRMVFMELLRMYTIIPFLPRALNKADQLGQYNLPADALLLVFFHGVHHNPRVWENPDVFDPERYTPERVAEQNSFAYLPFSAGPRKCAGNDLALLEGTLVIAMMLQKYNLNILPNQTFAAGAGATMHPRNGIKLTFSSRTLTE
jgi:cytochrome P450